MDDIKINEIEVEEKPKMIAFQLSNRLYESIREEAFYSKLSVSSMLRKILEEHYAELETIAKINNGKENN